MSKLKLALLTLLIFSLSFLLSGCGFMNQSPTASFTSNTDDLVVSFDGSGSSDSDGSIVSYSWDFGDDSTGSGETVTHTYDSSGSYNVELTVTDSNGAQDTLSKSISVTANQAPTASFTADPTTGVAPLDVSFDASGSSDPDGNIVSYSWDFYADLDDKDSTGTGETTNHTYDLAGTYTVELTVEDDDGATDSTTVDIEPYFITL